MPRILLAGFMGCGKTTTGEHLANALSLPFIDLDHAISERVGQPIARVFAEEGEEAFRHQEAAALRALPSDCVCALGGGALERKANLHWARAHAFVIYLEVPVRELVRRLQADASVRPLLLTDHGSVLDPTTLDARVRTMLNSRIPRYRQAHAVVRGAPGSPNEVASLCLEAYESRNDRR